MAQVSGSVPWWLDAYGISLRFTHVGSDTQNAEGQPTKQITILIGCDSLNDKH
jgi:hypothetical protein